MFRFFRRNQRYVVLLTILILSIGLPAALNLTTQNDDNCLLDPYIEYQDTLPPGIKPSIKINFSLNPSCSNTTGYKIYTTYNLFDGKYDNHVKRYYVLYNKSLERNGCVYPLINNDNQNCYLHEEDGSITSCYTWDDIKDKTIKNDNFDPRYRYVTKQRLNNNTCEFEQPPDKKELCYFFDNELIGDFKIKTEDSDQSATISNLEFNTTYQIKIALIRGGREGPKIPINSDVFFSATSNLGVQNYNKKIQNNQITRDKAYRYFFTKPKFKVDSKLIAPTRFNNESSPYQGSASILRLEDVLYRKYGYDLYYGVVGRGYDSKRRSVQPEELFIYKNCNLNLDVLDEQYNGDNKIYITCTEKDPKIIELIKQKSKCSKIDKNTLKCLSPDYGVSIALLGKARPTKISVNVNRADSVSSATSLNVSMLLLQNGLYKNDPYPLGLHLRKLITVIITSFIQENTVENLRNKLTAMLEELSASNSLNNYPNQKQFQENILTKIYNEAITATRANGPKQVITKNFVNKYLTRIFNLTSNLCNNELDTTYCASFYSSGAINDLTEISPKLKEAFLQSYNKENKSWKWNLYADNEVLKNIADFELYQIGLLSDFINPKSKITSIINGGELFSYTPSSLPLYEGYDKHKRPYSYYINKTCKENNEWCNDREEWFTDLSENFKRQQRVFTNKFSSLFSDTPFKKPYIYYYTAHFFPSESRRDNPDCLYAEITSAAFDLNCGEKYLTRKNKDAAYLANISSKKQRNKYLNRGDEYFNHFFSTFEDTLYLNLNGATYGYLKLNYMTGSIGWCNYYHTNSFKEEPTLTDLPASVKDTLAVSKVSAEFSYLDDFLKNSEIISINNKEIDKYKTSSSDNSIVVVRKEYGKQHWLVIGVSKDFVTRDIKLNIKNDHINIISSPAGNLYEIAFTNEYGEILEDGNSNGELKTRLIDDAKTFSLMSEGDESLDNMKLFGDFYLPIVVNPLPTPDKKCDQTSLTILKGNISDDNYVNFVLSQVKSAKKKRKKQLKKARELINSYNDDINKLFESVKVCSPQDQASFSIFKDSLEDAKKHLMEIYNLTSKVIRQQRKKKRKLNNDKNNNYYNEKLFFLNQYQDIYN